jgi:hypothetical protein
VNPAKKVDAVRRKPLVKKLTKGWNVTKARPLLSPPPTVGTNSQYVADAKNSRPCAVLPAPARPADDAETRALVWQQLLPNSRLLPPPESGSSHGRDSIPTVRGSRSRRCHTRHNPHPCARPSRVGERGPNTGGLLPPAHADEDSRGYLPSGPSLLGTDFSIQCELFSSCSARRTRSFKFAKR